MIEEVIIKRLKHGGFVISLSEEEDVVSEAEAAFSTLSEALSFIRSKMEPEGEGKRSLTAEEIYAKLKRAQAEEAAARSAALDDLQRLGQEADAGKPIKDVMTPEQIMAFPAKPDAPPEPAWKRAKVGDWVKLRSGRVDQVTKLTTSHDCRLMVASPWMPGSDLFVANTEVVAILPEPPRHGDFGSMDQEDDQA